MLDSNSRTVLLQLNSFFVYLFLSFCVRTWLNSDEFLIFIDLVVKSWSVLPSRGLQSHTVVCLNLHL